MTRRLVALGWIGVTAVPLLLAAVFIFGCCILPFHQVAHKLMPICHLAADLIRGGTADRHGTAQQPAPAREKDQPVKRLLTETPASYWPIAPAPADVDIRAASASNDYRSFISLGATRCDQDVGLYVLVVSLLI